MHLFIFKTLAALLLRAAEQGLVNPTIIEHIRTTLNKSEARDMVPDELLSQNGEESAKKSKRPK